MARFRFPRSPLLAPLVLLAATALAPIAATPSASASSRDAGIEFEIDRESFELRVRDTRDGAEGPRLRVTLGSPAHPTPRGRFPLENVVLNPGWEPGPRARAAGARSEPPSSSTPMGAAKIPFAAAGAYSLHGGAVPLVLGKPVSNGCIRAGDAELLRLIDWLDARGALGREAPTHEGEVHRRFRRPARLLTR